MSRDYVITQSNQPIYAYIKARNEIVKYNDPTFGMALLIFHGEGGLIALGENEISNYDCEIIDLTEQRETVNAWQNSRGRRRF